MNGRQSLTKTKKEKEIMKVLIWIEGSKFFIFKKKFSNIHSFQISHNNQTYKTYY